MKLLRKVPQLIILAFYLVIAVAVIGSLVPGGWKLKDVATGSMQPAIKPGTLVIDRPAALSSIQVGQVITYRPAAHPGETITHRVVAKTTKSGVPYFITKGDANNSNDPEIVGGQIVGRVAVAIPYLGWLLEGTHTWIGLGLVVILPGLLVIIYELRLMSRRLKQVDGAASVPAVEAIAKSEAAAEPAPTPIEIAPPPKARSLDGMSRRSMVIVLLIGLAILPLGVTHAQLKSSVTLTGNTISTINASPSPTPNCSTSNSNHITVINGSNQTASSGNATSSGNTAGSASSGSASNSNNTSTTITINNGSGC